MRQRKHSRRAGKRRNLSRKALVKARKRRRERRERRRREMEEAAAAMWMVVVEETIRALSHEDTLTRYVRMRKACEAAFRPNCHG